MSMRAPTMGQPSKEKSRIWRIAIVGLIVILVLLGLWVVSQRWDRVVQSGPLYPGIAADIEGSLVDKGAYIYRAAGCVACHTAEGGAELAGGHAFATPAPTLRPIRRPASADGLTTIWSARSAKGKAPMAVTTSRPFPTPPTP